MKKVQELGSVIVAVMGWGMMGLLARYVVCGIFPDLGACRSGPVPWFIAAIGVGGAIIVSIVIVVAAVYMIPKREI